MRIILIISVCLALTLQAKAQSTIKGSFSKEDDFLNNPSKVIELKDSIWKCVLLYNKHRLIFNDNVYLFTSYKNNILLTDSLTKNNIGSIKKSFRSFSFEGNDYKFSKKNRKGYNFVIRDKSNNLISRVKYAEVKNGYSIEICNNENDNLLPFVFLVALGYITADDAAIKLMYFIIATNIMME